VTASSKDVFWKWAATVGSFSIKAATSKGGRDMVEAQGKGRARGEEWRDLQGRDPSEALREILATEEEEDLEGGAAAT
jgi:hypothetical protein